MINDATTPTAYSSRVAAAKVIDRLVLDLNKDSGLRFHVVQVLVDNPTYTDAFVYESKYRYTQAMRLHKKDNGRLASAKCLNFKPEVRFEQPSLPEVLGEAARALVTPDMVGRRNLRPGETLEPVAASVDFGLASVREDTRYIRAYTPFQSFVAQNHKTYGKAFNAIF